MRNLPPPPYSPHTHTQRRPQTRLNKAGDASCLHHGAREGILADCSPLVGLRHCSLHWAFFYAWFDLNSLLAHCTLRVPLPAPARLAVPPLLALYSCRNFELLLQAFPVTEGNPSDIASWMLVATCHTHHLVSSVLFWQLQESKRVSKGSGRGCASACAWVIALFLLLFFLLGAP